MDRLAAGIMIAFAALMMSGGLVRDAEAEEAALPQAMAEPIIRSQSSAGPGRRGDRVLGLVMALEALRLAPAVLGPARD